MCSPTPCLLGHSLEAISRCGVGSYLAHHEAGTMVPGGEGRREAPLAQDSSTRLSKPSKHGGEVSRRGNVGMRRCEGSCHADHGQKHRVPHHATAQLSGECGGRAGPMAKQAAASSAQRGKRNGIEPKGTGIGQARVIANNRASCCVPETSWLMRRGHLGAEGPWKLL